MKVIPPPKPKQDLKTIPEKKEVIALTLEMR